MTLMIHARWKALGLSLSIIAAVFLFGTSPREVLAAEDPPPQDTCTTCHLELMDELLTPAEKFLEDVHFANGISCAGCHGGDPTSDDPETSMSPANGFLAKPNQLEIPQYCNRCHGDAAYMAQYNPSLPVDQLVKYKTSVHGQKNSSGDAKAATCTSCHGVHGIRTAKNPLSSVYAKNIPNTCNECHGDAEYMKDYGIPTDQLVHYAKSVHGVALLEHGDTGAPACNDCHGNHGAVPPGVDSIANVCGVCHASASQLFQKSPHRDAYEAMELAQCEVCHGNHGVMKPGDFMVGTHEDAVCMECHGEGDVGYETAAAVRAGLDRLTKAHEAAHVTTQTAELKGMFVDDTVLLLDDARQKLIMARNLVHSLDREAIQTQINEGLDVTRTAEEQAQALLTEVKTRRYGLGAVTVLVLILTILLYMKIRHMEAS